MNKSCFMKIACGVVAFSILIGTNNALVTAEPISSDITAPGNYDTASYKEYINQHGAIKSCGESVTVSAENISDSKDASINSGFTGYDEDITETSETGYAEYTFDIQKDGYYSINLDYYVMENNREAAERSVFIDGALPFSEARTVLFPRVFADVKDPDRDDKTRPDQEEIFCWQNTYIADMMGYQGDRLYFYLTAGSHNLKLVSVKEPMAIGKITMSGVGDDMPSYSDYLARAKSQGAKEVTGLSDGMSVYEAERTYQKSDPTLYSISDRASPATTPYSYSDTLLNTVGGSKWSSNGQWISWELDVPKTGLYKLALRSRQNFVRGMYVSRRLYIDDIVPFKEASDIKFYYSDGWQLKNLGGEEDYLFFLEEGKRYIKLEVTLGDLTEPISRVQESLNALNGAYWDLVTVMGLTPDVNRDYHIKSVMPEILETFKTQSELLYDLAGELEAKTGQKDSYTVALTQLARQLDKMAKNENVIAAGLSQLYDNIGALANFITLSNQQPLQLDKIILSQPDAELPKAEKGFFAKLWHEIMMLFSTFFNDYNTISDEGSADYPTIRVWIGNGLTGGRDQAQVLKRLTTGDFIPKNKINVNLQLIPAGTLLSATLAGKGPDVSLQTNGSDPVNYAMRGAVLNLKDFSDFNTVANQFTESTLVPYTYLNGVYALPETQSFYMMFYRKDILSELGINAESLKTWQDIINIIPDLQNNHYVMGLPMLQSTYSMFLYQSGGEYYRDDGKKSNLDNKTSTDAFKFWSEFYTNYKLPIEYNFENRFRFGSMPLAIADYTMYNLLSISAPEIRGLWGILPVPGIEQPDGSVDNTVAVGGAGTILMKSSKLPDESWEFMKWWVSTDTQVSFGLELESVMGTAARYNTANVEAIKRLPWSSADKSVLLDQFEHSKGVPEVPGGYYTARYIDFAIRDVTNENLEPRRVLLSYISSINEEITTKRLEFGLDD